MVVALISKNNGFLEYEEVIIDVPTSPTVDQVKLLWARSMYEEEDLFTLEGPHEIKLYHMPHGEDMDELTSSNMSQLQSWIRETPSQWVLDIFGRPLVTSVESSMDIDATER